jgi:hypothetical protein
MDYHSPDLFSVDGLVVRYTSYLWCTQLRSCSWESARMVQLYGILVAFAWDDSGFPCIFILCYVAWFLFGSFDFLKNLEVGFCDWNAWFLLWDQTIVLDFLAPALIYFFFFVACLIYEGFDCFMFFSRMFQLSIFVDLEVSQFTWRGSDIFAKSKTPELSGLSSPKCIDLAEKLRPH